MIGWYRRRRMEQLRQRAGATRFAQAQAEARKRNLDPDDDGVMTELMQQLFSIAINEASNVSSQRHDSFDAGSHGGSGDFGGGSSSSDSGSSSSDSSSSGSNE